MVVVLLRSIVDDGFVFSTALDATTRVVIVDGSCCWDYCLQLLNATDSDMKSSCTWAEVKLEMDRRFIMSPGK
jgi:hypothetical protein